MITEKKKVKIKAQGIKKIFTTENRQVTALDGVNLEVFEKEFVTFLGPSGCGKSTFLYIIAGFENPTEGDVLIDGKPIMKPQGERGIVFQEYVLFPWQTVEQNIRFGLDIQKKSKQESQEITHQLIKLTGLEGFEKAYPHTLSGGMQQRVAIARALAYDPDILLMDEPFGALDAQTRRRMIRDLVNIWHETGKTILFVTHSVEESLMLSDRMFLFSARPSNIKEVFDVKMQRPRDITSPEFVNLEKQILDSLDVEVDKMMTLEP